VVHGRKQAHVKTENPHRAASGGRKRILFVIASLEGGGAERVMIRILQRLNRRKFQPSILLIERKGVFLNDVPEDVPIFDCGRYGRGGRIAWMIHFVRIVRRQNPDVIVSFLTFTNVVSLLARLLAGVSCRLIVSERSTIKGSQEGVVTEAGRRLAVAFLYRFADCIVPNSEALRGQLVGIFRLAERKVVVVRNPVDLEVIEARAREPLDILEAMGDKGSLVVGMGRFTPEKGFDLLIRAVAFLPDPVKLMLLGEGREKEALRRLAAGLGISDRVEFLGFQENPYPILRKATVFVLPSRYEGFPNALLEAMAVGTPCVATRCATGPEEIITDGVDGLLVSVEDPRGLAEAIEQFLSDPLLRARAGIAGRERVKDFDAPGILRQWEGLLEGVAG
jgi:glycosyltransferase involved in cell wall biosynthesis